MSGLIQSMICLCIFTFVMKWSPSINSEVENMTNWQIKFGKSVENPWIIDQNQLTWILKK